MKKKSLIILSLLPLLVACGGSNIPLEFKKYNNDFVELDTVKNQSSETYYQVDNLGNVDLLEDYPVMNDVSSVSSLQDIARGSNKQYLNSIGVNKLLVIPIAFKDSNEKYLNQKHILIENAFFGESDYTSYESVASYYNKSSYGHLKIEGEVTDWISYPYATSELTESINTRDKIINYAIEQLEANEFDFTPYSTINENYIDAIYFIYDAPQKSPTSEIYWAITEHKSQSSNHVINYSWSSFYFMQDEGDNVLSSHEVRSNTYIHETGHLFGLVDYYNTKGNSGSKNYHYSYQPTGLMDMMDYNLGDHCSFSKFVLGWSTPLVIKKEGSIDLHPFTNSGEFILLPAGNYNNTPFDEYLLIEYYVPENLNDLKGFPSYIYIDGSGEERVFTYPEKYGLRVYHIDARLGYYVGKFATPRQKALLSDVERIKEIYEKNSTYIDFYNSNANTYVYGSNSKVPNTLVHLLESSGNNTFKDGRAATSSTMFARGSSFGVDTYQDFQFNSGAALEYSFTIKEFRKDYITIEFNSIK